MALEVQQSGSTYYLYDAEILPTFSPDVFTQAGDEPDNQHGRGAVQVVAAGGHSLVRKHYRRGGLVRHLVHDTYAYQGLARTRMWREAEFIHALTQRGLPVARFAAARCSVHFGWRYSGDLITVLLPTAETLAERLQAGALDQAQWRNIGAVIAKFHAEGVYHADLNANNILLDRAGLVFLIDFDKAYFKKPEGRWQGANLERLLRSLHKQQRLLPAFHFNDQAWLWLLNAYAGGR